MSAKTGLGNSSAVFQTRNNIFIFINIIILISLIIYNDVWPFEAVAATLGTRRFDANLAVLSARVERVNLGVAVDFGYERFRRYETDSDVAY